jgi:hypothetical protein
MLLRRELIVLASLLMPAVTLAQDGGCHIPTNESSAGIGWLTALVTSNRPTDSLFRSSLHVTTRSASDVSLVTSDSVCALGAKAIAQVENVPYKGVSVYVYKVGDVYVVDEHFGAPAAAGSEWRRMYFFDLAFNFLAMGGR